MFKARLGNLAKGLLSKGVGVATLYSSMARHSPTKLLAIDSTPGTGRKRNLHQITLGYERKCAPLEAVSQGGDLLAL